MYGETEPNTCEDELPTTNECADPKKQSNSMAETVETTISSEISRDDSSTIASNTLSSTACSDGSCVLPGSCYINSNANFILVNSVNSTKLIRAL